MARKLSEYNKFMGEQLRKGLSFMEAVAAWKKHKG